MRNLIHKGRNTATRKLNKGLIAILAVAVLSVTVVAVVSMRSGQAQTAKVDATNETRSTPVPTSKTRGYVTTNADGDLVVLDRETNQTRDLTPEEAQRLAEGIKQLVNQSTEGLVEVRKADGSVSMDLEGRFQNVMVAKVEADGTLSTSCVDNPISAARFFEIDPKLLGVKEPVLKGQSVPNKPEIR